MTLADASVVLLCGGRGMLVEGQSAPVPKAMVTLGNRALVWHVMKRFSMYGVRRFVFALGRGGDRIRDYFLSFTEHHYDLRIHQGEQSVQVLGHGPENDWEMTFVNTGDAAGTGARVARCQQHVEGRPFFVSYADCLANVDVAALFQAHQTSGKSVTVTGVKPHLRYGEFQMDGDQVVAFSTTSRVTGAQGYINGGFMVWNPDALDALDVMDECVLEGAVLSRLVEARRLGVYRHEGFWYPVDTPRDVDYLERRWLSNQSDWLHL